MKNEKNILLERLDNCMRDERDTPDYASLIKQAKIGDREFDTYLEKLAKERRFMESIDPYEVNSTGTQTDKINKFLQEHAHLDYNKFIKQANPGNFNTDDYSALPKPALKRRLFDHRARLYLAALADCEKEGINIANLLSKIKEGIIPYLKRERNEPTFSAILKAVNEHIQ